MTLNARDDRSQSDADHVITVEKLNELSAKADAWTAAADRLAAAAIESQQKETTARQRYRKIVVGLGVGLSAILAAIGVLIGFNYAYLVNGRGVRDQIIDCVQPTGHCYQDAQKRTASVVGTVNEVSELAAACAPSYVHLPLTPRIAAIEQCIQAHLTK